MFRSGFGLDQSFMNDFFGGDPFARMNSMFPRMQFGQDMFGSDPFFSGRLQPRSSMEERTHNSQRDQPYVEEPDEDPSHASLPRHSRRSGGFRVPVTGESARDASISRIGPGVQSYSFSSTTVIHGNGEGGYTYKKSETTKRLPGGVMEQHKTESDSRTGVEKVGVHRQIGDRSRMMVRERRADGTEDKREHLHNMSEHDRDHFEEEWQQRMGGTRSRYIENTPATTSSATRSRMLQHHPQGDSRAYSSTPVDVPPPRTTSRISDRERSARSDRYQSSAARFDNI